MVMEDSSVRATKTYLTPDQISHVREELDLLSSFDGFLGVIALIDRYVHFNETADEEYDRFFELLNSLNGVQKEGLCYPENIKATLPLISGIAFYDFVLFTGVISAEELSELQSASMKRSTKNGIPQA